MSMIHTALIAAMHEIATKGIAKTSRADLGGAKVNFRGIEAAMNEMCVVLIHHKISVTPRYSEVQITERAKAEAGKATRFAVVKGAFTFSAEDGSNVVCECYGEAMDSGDKALTKAQSVAFRTALFQQFIVPTMAMDPEADAEEETDDDLLREFQDAAMAGVAELQKTFEKIKPPAYFWKTHSGSLKAAAAAADKAAA